jgi:hypothetical protein
MGTDCTKVDVFVDETVGHPGVVGIMQSIAGKAFIALPEERRRAVHNDRPIAAVEIRLSSPMMIEKICNRQQDGTRWRPLAVAGALPLPLPGGEGLAAYAVAGAGEGKWRGSIETMARMTAAVTARTRNSVSKPQWSYTNAISGRAAASTVKLTTYRTA